MTTRYPRTKLGEESVRALTETDRLAGERGNYRLARPIEKTQVPATVQAVLAARMDSLPPDEKHLLVELHGGRITVSSVPGQGSTFSFTLPVLKGSA